MPTFPLPITRVRHTGRAADLLLEAFMDGGRLAGRRPPRGIGPQQASQWIVKNVPPDCPPVMVMHATDTARYYELGDIVEHFKPFLNRREADARDYGRSMQVLQLMGDVGSPEQAAFAASYFKDVLLPNVVTMDSFALVLDTAEALALAVDMPAVERRLQAAIGSASGMSARKYGDYRNNDYPNAVLVVEGKRHLAKADPVQRLPDLVSVYLGGTAVSGPSMEVWAGRLIRAHANKPESHAAVIKTFSKAIDDAVAGKASKSVKDFAIHRAAQAIIYLQGQLTPAQEASYRAADSSQQNFLWDEY